MDSKKNIDMKIIVFIESANDKIHPVSLETLVAAQALAQKNNAEVYALTFNENLSNDLPGNIILVKEQNLNEYSPLYYLETLQQIYSNLNADIIMFGHTYETRDWVPRLSARLDLPFISDCTSCDYSDGVISLSRPIYQAKLIQKISLTSNKALISFQAGSYSIDDLESQNTNIEIFDADLSSVNNTIKPGEKFQESSGGVDLTAADYIVSVGRGIGKEENIPLAKAFAEKINAQIGSSRPVVDAGWLDHSRQIGSSGQTVSPKLYFALGISGAIQHLVGMKGSKQIIAINKDENAPIFEIADYAVIGDLLEILPKITDNL